MPAPGAAPDGNGAATRAVISAVIGTEIGTEIGPEIGAISAARCFRGLLCSRSGAGAADHSPDAAGRASL